MKYGKGSKERKITGVSRRRVSKTEGTPRRTSYTKKFKGR